MYNDGVRAQLNNYCVVITAATTADEVLPEEFPAELDPPPPQPTNTIAAVKASVAPMNLNGFMTTSSELAYAAEGVAFSLNQDCAATVHGDRICHKRCWASSRRKADASS